MAGNLSERPSSRYGYRQADDDDEMLYCASATRCSGVGTDKCDEALAAMGKRK